MVAITLTQLRALSEEFGFDYERAKEFLNLNTCKKPGRPTKVVSGGGSSVGTKQYDGTKIPSTAQLKELMKSEKTAGSGASRGKSGYNYFMNDISEQVKKNLQEKSRVSGEKMARNAVVSEVSQRWKSLSDTKKEAWNAYAKHQNSKN